MKSKHPMQLIICWQYQVLSLISLFPLRCHQWNLGFTRFPLLENSDRHRHLRQRPHAPSRLPLVHPRCAIDGYLLWNLLALPLSETFSCSSWSKLLESSRMNESYLSLSHASDSYP